MVATNDDILAELQKQTALLQKIKKFEKLKYTKFTQEDVDGVENGG